MVRGWKQLPFPAEERTITAEDKFRAVVPTCEAPVGARKGECLGDRALLLEEFVCVRLAL